jgi:divinyl chlorophyllide a 8-vinyl-reductase
VLRGTGTIGRATTAALVRRGHDVTCFVRARSGAGGSLKPADIAELFDGATVRVLDPTDAESLSRDGKPVEPHPADRRPRRGDHAVF